ncbi:unnamed protein product [Musa acuminata subsp. burmannicoides]
MSVACLLAFSVLLLAPPASRTRSRPLPLPRRRRRPLRFLAVASKDIGADCATWGATTGRCGNLKATSKLSVILDFHVVHCTIFNGDVSKSIRNVNY